MKKLTKLLVLAVVAVVALFWLWSLSVRGPQAVQQAGELVRAKLSGQAAYLSWGRALWSILPDSLRPAEKVPIQHLEACLRVPIRLLQKGSGPCGTQWETPLGVFWAGRDDGDLLAHVVKENLLDAVYHRPPVAVRQGDVVIDGGAHIGTFARLAFTKGARKVVAFEPDPRNVECLNRTFRQEVGEGRLVVVAKALWSGSGRLDLKRGLNSAQSWVAEKAENPEESVPATSIDDAVAELGLDRVDFVKLDIEGAERQALAGAVQTVRRFGPRMALCTYHRVDDPVKITEAVMRIRPSYWMFARAEQAYYYEAGR